MTNVIHIVDTARANVGELVAILSSVGELPDGYRRDARPVAEDDGQRGVNRQLEHFTEVGGGFG